MANRVLSFQEFAEHCIHHVDQLEVPDGDDAWDVVEVSLKGISLEELKEAKKEEVNIEATVNLSGLIFDPTVCEGVCFHESCSGGCFENTCPIWDKLGEDCVN
ncbi:hypothetical protein DRO66_00565 [Candidatus Bathyarchaeota archaeon]|nr:MAG: hypothetical protein DRO66_00565 [Candidatus Bathyarchaeota archaeon]